MNKRVLKSWGVALRLSVCILQTLREQILRPIQIMVYYSGIRRNKLSSHEKELRKLERHYSMTEANLKGLHTI